MTRSLVRFDDMVGGRHLQMRGLVEELSTDEPGEVIAIFNRVEERVGQGLYAAGFISYEAAPGLDPNLEVRTNGRGRLCWFGLYSAAEEVGPPLPAAYEVGNWEADTTDQQYTAAVDEIRRLINAGDTYQVNYTMRLAAPFAGEASGLYYDLCRTQPTRYAAFFDLPDFQVISASPELFFSMQDDVLVTKPMKGTKPRGRWPAEDQQMAEELRRSPKEQAENLMIVDLLRNDLGRIARFGSVKVDRLFDVERYPTLWQMTSTISCRIRPGVGLAQLVTALFPSGSVTGAPKISTMGIIADLEATQRGVYCGAIGFLAPALEQTKGWFSVAIRTLTIANGTATYGTGGGITYDSSAVAELAESKLKTHLLTTRLPEFRLIETMRWDPTEGIANLAGHLRRLYQSADYFEFVCDESAIGEALGSLSGPTPIKVRLLLAADGKVVVESRSLDDLTRPTLVTVDSVPVDSLNPFLFHKTTLRSVYEEARARHPDVDDVILVNERGEVTETTVANLAVRYDQRWITPSLDSGCLPGVYRRMLLDGGRVAEGVVTVEDLGRADEIALISSVRAWRSAVLVED